MPLRRSRTFRRRARRATRRPVRRTFRRRVIRRRRPMTARRVANISSQKKQDNMLQWVPTDPNLPGGAGTISEQVITAGAGQAAFLFCPSARPFQPTQNDESDRNHKNTFARGYRETTQIRVNGGTPWRRRRITFSAKGMLGTFDSLVTGFTAEFFTLQTSSGLVRQHTVLPVAMASAVRSVLFAGAENLDWFSPMTAKVDTSRVTLHSDVMTVINPGNATGAMRNIKQWYPLNKNLVYNDDESGAGTASASLSTQSKLGMGDFFVLDFYESALASTDSISVLNQGTYYWHEK